MRYANNKGADQPANPCSLISAFVVRCLDSSFYVRNVKLPPSFCGCADQFEYDLIANPEDRFSREEVKCNTAIEH